MQSCLLQNFEQQIFACMVLAPSGEVELEWMMVLGYRQNYQNGINTFTSFFCSVFLLFMFSLLLCLLLNVVNDYDIKVMI